MPLALPVPAPAFALPSKTIYLLLLVLFRGVWLAALVDLAPMLGVGLPLSLPSLPFAAARLVDRLAGVISLISLAADNRLLRARFGTGASSGSPSVARDADRVIRLRPGAEAGTSGAAGAADNWRRVRDRGMLGGGTRSSGTGSKVPGIRGWRGLIGAVVWREDRRVVADWG